MLATTARAPSVVSTLGTFQNQMKALVARGLELDIRVFEVADVERIAAELQPATLNLLNEAQGLLAQVLHTCEASAPCPPEPNLPATQRSEEKRFDEIQFFDGTGDVNMECEKAPAALLPFERAIDVAVASNPGSVHGVEEVAFIAKLEIQQRVMRLERAKLCHRANALLSECDSSIRRLRKALNAVDAAIAKATKVPPLLDFTSELETSLAVRRAYNKFRSRVTAGGEPTPEHVKPRLRAIGTHMAILVGWSIYPDMRVQDRLLLRELQQRVLAWLRGDGDVTVEGGLRLWQDVIASVDLFSLVNRRQELVEHDAKVIQATLATLSSLGDEAIVDAAIHEKMTELEGLDVELDELLGRSPYSASALKSVLTRLANYRCSSALPPTPGEATW